MATTRWTGSTSSSWTTAGNWTNGVPGNGDIIIFPKTAVQGATTNTATNLNYAAIYTEEGFSYNVGSVSAPLTCGASLLSIVGNRQSTVYLTVTNTFNFGHIIVESPNVINALTINVGLGTVYRLEVLQGTVSCAEEAWWLTTKQTGRFNNIPKLRYTGQLLSGGISSTIISQQGGFVENARSDNFALWVVNGGEALASEPPYASTTAPYPAVRILGGLFRNEGSSTGVAAADPVDFYVEGGVYRSDQIDDAWQKNVFVWPEGTAYLAKDPVFSGTPSGLHYVGLAD